MSFSHLLLLLAAMLAVRPVSAANRHFLSPAASKLAIGTPGKAAQNSGPRIFPGSSSASFRRLASFVSIAPQDEPEPLTWNTYIQDVLISWIGWFALTLAAYFCCYRPSSPLPQRKVTSESGNHSTAADEKVDMVLDELLTSGHWRCLDDASICICSFLCIGLRWADTTSLARMLGFWTALLVFSFLTFFNAATGSVLFGLFTTFLILYFRHELRSKLGAEAWTCRSCVVDWCYVCWCPCCAVAQEARIVKTAIEMGHENFPPPEI